MTKRYILIILVLSLITRFVFFSHPAETVFDEVHFGKFVSGYFTGQYFFDIHPPLGKLIIAGMAKISGFQPGFSFENIGQKYPDDSYKWLRFLPKLAGALLPVIIFLIALELGLSQKFAFLTGLLLVFENSLLVQSRLILIDAFLLLFGFLGILFFLKFQKSVNYKRSPMTKNKYLFFSGLFSSLALSIKWTGSSFLGLILLLYFLNWIKSQEKLKSAAKGLIFLIIMPFLIYSSVFVIHFSLLNEPGPGLAFHPPNFQEMNIFEKFIDLNGELYTSNARLGANHPYSSQWFQWPFMNKPIFYWNGSTSSSQDSSARIYLIGNPLIYWLSTITVIFSIISFRKYFIPLSRAFGSLRNRPNTKSPEVEPSAHYETGLMLLLGFLANWLPFIFIGRVMFLYHYFTSLIFAVLILVLSFDISKFKNKKIIFNSMLVGSVILFLFFSPLTYGLAIPEWYYKMMVWLPSWR